MFRRPAPLSESHKLDEFDCGKAELNSFLVDLAMVNEREGYCRTYAIADPTWRVVGYCSICSSKIDRAIVPRQIGGHGAPREIPAILLARLAVDSRFQGQGLGADLLKHAMQIALLSAEKVGARALLVNAIDEDAVLFYQRYHFRSVKGLDRTLLRSLKDIGASMKMAKLQV